MKRLVCVELLQIHAKAAFYVVRFKEESVSEFEKFLDAHTDPKFQQNLKELVYWMDTIGKNGALDRYFRFEGGKVKAIPVERSQLRLYCYHLNQAFLIWAGGGHKRTRTYEEDPDLDFQVKLIRIVGDSLRNRLMKGTILQTGQTLSGNLEFEIEI